MSDLFDSATICLERGVSEMRVRVNRLRDEAARCETEERARPLREIAAIIEQAMWDVEDEAERYKRRFGGNA